MRSCWAVSSSIYVEVWECCPVSKNCPSIGFIQPHSVLAMECSRTFYLLHFHLLSVSLYGPLSCVVLSITLYNFTFSLCGIGSSTWFFTRFSLLVLFSFIVVYLLAVSNAVSPSLCEHCFILVFSYFRSRVFTAEDLSSSLSAVAAHPLLNFPNSSHI